jgi:hypothetical protein
VLCPEHHIVVIPKRSRTGPLTALGLVFTIRRGISDLLFD